MIDVYFWPTPNGYKVTIFCEEAELPYRLVPVNIGKGDQFAPEFLEISPNNKMPAIVDPDGPDGKPISIFESGAILLYLAEKTGKFLPTDPRKRWATVEWLMFQMGTVGPMLGQTHHFRMYAREKLEYAVDRYTNEATRIYNVLDRRLEKTAYVAGDDYTIADMATFPWLAPYKRQGQKLDDYPNVRRWFDELKSRPALRRGIDVGKQIKEEQVPEEERWSNLFGKAQYARR